MQVRQLLALPFAAALWAGAQLASAAPPAAFAPTQPDIAIEFYHAGFDHYFVTRIPEEIEALDSGRTTGWTRTGRAMRVYLGEATAGVPVSPVCRFYIPPEHGDSHFLSASRDECASVLDRILVDPNYSGYIHESPAVFFLALPDAATGACAAGAFPVYRLWNQRADSNHRYTTDAGIGAAMIARGYVAEGYGPDGVAMCSPEEVLVDALVGASGRSGFAAGCDGVPATGNVYVNAEVEPFIAVNPTNPNNLIGVWQQDRWSNGGSRGLAGAHSFDGGGTWTRTSAAFSRCSGGHAGNGGDFERASDPWVTFAPDGTAYQIALAFNNRANGDSAILVSRSTDGGRAWSDPVTLRRDGAQSFNDKESITADPFDARYVYAVWDRLTGNNGPAWFARTIDGGASWEPARVVYDPGANSQTINNQIVVLPDRTLVLFFTEIANVGAPDIRLRIVRSGDQGATWSAPITIASQQSVGTVDPDTGTGIRDGSILGSIAAGSNGMLAAAWQDARFSGTHDDIAFAQSTDGGLTWSAPLRVNGGNVAPPSSTAPALLPVVAIRDDGVFGVAYYDLRANTPDVATLPTLYWLATSNDGLSWTERQLAGPFDFATAPLAGGRYFIGDYSSMVTIGTSFVPFFGRSTGDPDNRSDILAALARPGAAGTGTTVKFATDEAVPTTAEFTQRVRANARRVLAGRLPAQPLP